ncbi:ANTAR domain-containing protein [Streptomyces sp. NPDC054834]
MTTSRVPRSSLDGIPDGAVIALLEQENAQLRHAVDSHAAVDQAIGVLTASHQLAPAVGVEVLREVSQHTNTKLQTVIAWALGQPLPERRAGAVRGRAAVLTPAGCPRHGSRVGRGGRARRGSGGQGLVDGGMAADDLVQADDFKKP